MYSIVDAGNAFTQSTKDEQLRPSEAPRARHVAAGDGLVNVSLGIFGKAAELASTAAFFALILLIWPLLLGVYAPRRHAVSRTQNSGWAPSAALLTLAALFVESALRHEQPFTAKHNALLLNRQARRASHRPFRFRPRSSPSPAARSSR
jgi:hypothetical protein